MKLTDVYVKDLSVVDSFVVILHTYFKSVSDEDPHKLMNIKAISTLVGQLVRGEIVWDDFDRLCKKILLFNGLIKEE